jgi:hypothetical protein
MYDPNLENISRDYAQTKTLVYAFTPTFLWDVTNSHVFVIADQIDMYHLYTYKFANDTFYEIDLQQKQATPVSTLLDRIDDKILVQIKYNLLRHLCVVAYIYAIDKFTALIDVHFILDVERIYNQLLETHIMDIDEKKLYFVAYRATPIIENNLDKGSTDYLIPVSHNTNLVKCITTGPQFSYMHRVAQYTTTNGISSTDTPQRRGLFYVHFKSIWRTEKSRGKICPICALVTKYGKCLRCRTVYPDVDANVVYTSSCNGSYVLHHSEHMNAQDLQLFYKSSYLCYVKGTNIYLVLKTFVVRVTLANTLQHTKVPTLRIKFPTRNTDIEDLVWVKLNSSILVYTFCNVFHWDLTNNRKFNIADYEVRNIRDIQMQNDKFYLYAEKTLYELTNTDIDPDMETIIRDRIIQRLCLVTTLYPNKTVELYYFEKHKHVIVDTPLTFDTNDIYFVHTVHASVTGGNNLLYGKIMERVEIIGCSMLLQWMTNQDIIIYELRKTTDTYEKDKWYVSTPSSDGLWIICFGDGLTRPAELDGVYCPDCNVLACNSTCPSCNQTAVFAVCTYTRYYYQEGYIVRSMMPAIQRDKAYLCFVEDSSIYVVAYFLDIQVNVANYLQ